VRTAGMGVTMVGPTILEYGTEDQKQRHIPRICRGEVFWALGYSEPNAGSDLASLSMKAELSNISGTAFWPSSRPSMLPSNAPSTSSARSTDGALMYPKISACNFASA